jgi:hypothetical protein
MMNNECQAGATADSSTQPSETTSAPLAANLMLYVATVNLVNFKINIECQNLEKNLS